MDGALINLARKEGVLPVKVAKGNFYIKFTKERIYRINLRISNCTICAVFIPDKNVSSTEIVKTGEYKVMRLTKELKNRTDEYFDNISAEELYELAVGKYNFVEVNFELENESFQTVDEPFCSTFGRSDNYNFPEAANRELALAA